MTRRLDGFIGLLAIPFFVTRRGVNVVVGDYYGMLIGRTFDNDREAASHYFSHGWRLGVVPSPFIHATAAHYSTIAALLLRHQLARVARGAEPHSRWLGTPSRLIDAGKLAGSLDHRGGWIAALTERARSDGGSVMIRVGGARLPWDSYLEGCRRIAPAAAVVLENDLIDLPFYEMQIGGYRALSAPAALDDYIANGEIDGRMPNPFFEAEWYQATDRSQARRQRPVNLFLDYVAMGELGPASPHFWGKRYAAALDAPADPPSLLSHFLRHARPDDMTPSCDLVTPVRTADAERIVRERVNAYHEGLGVVRAVGPVLRRHVVATPEAQIAGTCLVIVDERHLRHPAAVDALALSADQTITGLRVAIIESDDVARIAQLDELVRRTPTMDFVPRRDGETTGAVVRRLLDDATPDGWTFWTPAERWMPHYLAAAVTAIRRNPTVAAAAAVARTTPQPWLRTEDALWVDGLSGAGVVFRGSGADARQPDATLDLGVAWHLLIGMAARDRCAVIDEALVIVAASAPTRADTELRAGANAARNRYLTSFDGAPRDGVTVVMPTYEDWNMTVSAVRRVLETTADDVSTVVIDNGSRRPVSAILAACFAAEPRVTVRRLPVNTDFAVGSNVGASTLWSATTVFLNNDTSVQDGWLDPLLDALDGGVGAVQPLLLFGDRTVQTAGTIFFGGMSMPRHLFSEVHPGDVDRSIDDYEFSALTAACLAVGHKDVAALGGFDPHYVNGMEDVDFCLRLKSSGRRLRVRSASRVVHFESRTAGRHDHQLPNRRRFAQRWRRALTDQLDDRAFFDQGQLELVEVHWKHERSSPLREALPVLRRRASAIRVEEHPPRLRWAIKSSATGDLAGDVWGDTFFAEALADALGRLGQEAVVDRSTSHVRASTGWDDITLTLRGLSSFLPQPDALNLLWVISHPDLVTRQELESGYARIYSAGPAWASQVRERWGLDVRTLLQATDATRFSLTARDDRPQRGVLFVGRTRGVSRPIVTDAIAAGADPEVYGDDGWEQFIHPRYVKGAGISNEELPAAYAGARIVLNDHWRDMAEFGFYSNRLFDAAATGARVVSDHVDGIDELFGGQVRTYTEPSELARLLDAESPDWPEQTELEALARKVGVEHSFDARARVLLDDALELRGAKR
ncbi:glycosyltransferase family protein [Microbacterium sp. CFBP9034]|uniref:glycosyltransferase family protein n=1 Tax=Microbacterium sp. CFBP9034 TaxID=3096540 RepID=UPI002A6ADD9B|nr:glycosyltransferase [Microbacterium sp. CFBP9034]MDY0909007.1 glycosyltransferase [Microbacterium sp. CFBP9034]